MKFVVKDLFLRAVTHEAAQPDKNVMVNDFTCLNENVLNTHCGPFVCMIMIWRKNMIWHINYTAVKVESRQLRQQNKMSTFQQSTGSFTSVHFI